MIKVKMSLWCPYCENPVDCVRLTNERTDFIVEARESPILRTHLEMYIVEPCGHEVEILIKDGEVTLLKRSLHDD